MQGAVGRATPEAVESAGEADAGQQSVAIAVLVVQDEVM